MVPTNRSEGHESQNPESAYSSIQSMVQEVKMLQGVLDTTTGLEEKWALEEDIIGKVRTPKCNGILD